MSKVCLSPVWLNALFSQYVTAPSSFAKAFPKTIRKKKHIRSKSKVHFIPFPALEWSLVVLVSGAFRSYPGRGAGRPSCQREGKGCSACDDWFLATTLTWCWRRRWARRWRSRRGRCLCLDMREDEVDRNLLVLQYPKDRDSQAFRRPRCWHCNYQRRLNGFPPQ